MLRSLFDDEAVLILRGTTYQCQNVSFIAAFELVFFIAVRLMRARSINHTEMVDTLCALSTRGNVFARYA